MRSKGRFTAVITVICLLFTGCSQVKEAFNQNVQQTTKAEKVVSKDVLMDQGPVRGGTLRLFCTFPDTLNPILTSNVYVREMLLNVYEGLVSLDNHLNPVPGLAEKWTVSEDLSTWTFILRKNVLWQDNIPFTAEDVEFTMDQIMKYGAQSSYRSKLDNIAAYAAVDKDTFRVSLKSPNSFTAETMNFPILAKHYYLGEDFANTEKNNKPMGTGPYKFVSYEPQKSISLMLSDKWWDSKGTEGSNVQKPYIAELRYNLFENGNSAVNAFQSSQVDIAGMNKDDSAKYLGRQDLTIKKYPNREYSFLAFNMSKPALGVKAVRQSIAYALDKDKLLREILSSQATLSELPELPNSWLNYTTKKTYEFNIEKSQQLLSDDGWKQTQYGLYRYINGSFAQLNLELLVNSENNDRVRTAQFISDELSPLGIHVNVKSVDFNTFQNLLASKSYDMALVGCRVPVIPDLSFLYGSWNTKGGYNNCYNIAGYSNGTMDSLLQKAMTSRGTVEDGNKLKQIYTDIGNLALDELPYLGLYFNNDSMLYSKKVRGEISPSVTDRYNDIVRWYIP